MRPQIRRIEVIGNTPVNIQEYVTDLFTVPITQALIDSIDVRVFDGEEQVDNGSLIGLSSASYVFDTLQTGHGWDVDDDGFNFEIALPSDLFYREKGVYRVEVMFTTTSESTGPIYCLYDLEVLSVLSRVV